MKKTDCYFYFEHCDMGANISCCSNHFFNLGYCPCEECNNYLSKANADKAIKRNRKDRNTIPMSVIDDIKAEIEEHIKYNKKMNYMGVVSGLLISRDIINDYTGKEQSE